MPYKCKLINVNHIYGETKIRNPQPGDIYYAPWVEEFSTEFGLSEQYIKDWQGKRPPIFIILPNGIAFCPDQKSRSGINYKVEGEVPNITVTPNIKMGNYFGWLQDGILSDSLS